MALAVARPTWPLQLFTATLLLAAGWWSITTGDATLVRLAGRVEALAAGGLAGGFALHEVAHAVVLRRCPGVSHLVVTATAWRFSLEPRGTMTPGQVAAVALAGPGAAATCGLLLLAVLPQAGLHWWFLAHLLFLLPVFGDGRSLLLVLGSAARPGVRRSTGR